MLLMIVKGQNSWVVRLANTQKRWTFQGVDLEEQATNVEYLGTSMQGGYQNVVNNLNEILELGPNEGADAVVQTLFSATDGLQLNGVMIFNTADEVLLDVLEDVGAALVAAL